MGGVVKIDLVFAIFSYFSFGIPFCRAHLPRFLWLVLTFRSGTILLSGEAEAALLRSNEPRNNRSKNVSLGTASSCLMA